MIGAEAKQDSNNDRTRWDLLDLLVEQIGAERHWIKSNNCLSTKRTLHDTVFAANVLIIIARIENLSTSIAHNS